MTVEKFDRIYAVEFLPNEADIRVGGVSHFLTPRASLCLLYREMTESLGRGAEPVLFRAGHERGRKFYWATAGALFSEEQEAILAAAKFLSSHLGLNHVQSLTLDSSEGKAQLIVDRSFEVCPRHPSPRPRCHLLRGFWAGLLEEVLGGGRPITGKERECQGMRNPFCRFEFSPAPVPAK